MRLSWLALAFAVIAVGWADTPATSPSTETSSPSTAADTDAPGVTTTIDEASTTTGEPGPVVTEGTPGSTAEPQTEPPESTDDGNTDKTKAPEKTTAKVVTTVTTTTKKAVSTTTKEPQPDVESFSVTCSKPPASLCTYTMQVPGLDIDTYDRLMKETNDTGTEVENYESTDLVNLQAGVTKVFDDALATVGYVQSQLDSISAEISYLEVQATTLKNDIEGVNTAVATANNYLNKILNKKGSCLYRQCVLKEPTTTRPVTTTTTKAAPVLYCSTNKNPCEHDGKCNDWYGSYYCTCKGNLDGQDFNCASSVCDVIKDVQDPGLIVSPGYYNSTNTGSEPCDGAQWTVKATNSSKVLGLVEKSFTDNISKLLSADANLQLTVSKYKLKITSKTKYNQITQILAYGSSATISYSGSEDDYFHFELTEIDNPNP